MNRYEGQPGNRGALINYDMEAYVNYWKIRKDSEARNNKIDEINNIKEQVNNIMQEQAEIKNLLLKLLEK